MTGSPRVAVDHRDAEDRVVVTVDGDDEPFTEYRYGDDLRKPVLSPIRAPSGVRVTRGYPIDPQPGERVDHDHHVGSWLNFGHVSGHDLWNYTGDPTSLHGVEDGGIVRHDSVDRVETGGSGSGGDGDGGDGDRETGVLETTATWVVPEGEVLEESTMYEFGASSVDSGAGGGRRYVDRTTTLTALDDAVELHDDKEGLFAVRVATGLEHPTDGPTTRITADGDVEKVEVAAGDQPTGEYYTAASAWGADAWGTRAKWVRLAGEVGGEDVTLTIMDHPDNVGHPTFWHARHYGLFAANPLSPSVFSRGEFDRMDFELDEGESVTFRFRLAVEGGEPSGQELEERFAAFAAE